jgi:glycyl-tRNA synthetase beta chain
MPDFLLEIRCEELPAGYLEPALAQLRRDFRALLKGSGLTSGGIVVDGTPRRIVLAAKKVPERTPERKLEIQGPSEKIAFKDDNPTKAAEGFARKHGLSADELVVRETPKGRYCFAQVADPGRPTIEVLAQAIPRIIAGLSFPKSMRWVSREQTFARPVRSLLALLGAEVVGFEYAGVRSGRSVSGHPFLAPEPFEVAEAGFVSFARTLEGKYVILSVEKRKRLLREQVLAHLEGRGAVFPPEDEALLNEVTNMVEWPNIIEGSFYKSFLDLPAEVLEAAMKEHQRYFPVRTGEGKLLAHFLTAIDRPDKHIEAVRRGHESVLRARLSDARFFFEEDQKTPFAKRVAQLKGVTFQEKLGSYYEKAQRLRNFAGALGQKQGLSPKEIVQLQQAAQLCKADLVTQMVGEFPSLQGVVGNEYARRAGLPEPVATAIAEHYLPRRAGDKLPQTTFGRILSLTDKFDNIAAFFSINLIPTGSADPFALRRQAGAVIRIIQDAGLRLSLSENFIAAIAEMPVAKSQKKIALGEIMKFFRERLANMLVEQGRRYDIVDAVLATGFDDLIGVSERLGAVEAVSQKDYWQGLCEIVERTYNIYRGVELSGKINEKLLAEKEEKELAAVYKKTRPKFKELVKKGDYKSASKLYYEAFAKPVHLFFDKVFVNVEDESLKKNRMILNYQINRLYAERIADLSKIVFEGEKQ